MRALDNGALGSLSKPFDEEIPNCVPDYCNQRRVKTT
jgi:hypothetical protein